MLNKNVNVLELHSLVFHLTNNNCQETVDSVIKVFDNFTQNINEKFSTGQISLQQFTNEYSNYVKRSEIVMKHLSYLNGKVKTDYQTFVELVSQYLFYKNVINVKYNNLYMYEILRDIIVTDTSSLTYIKQLLEMYSYFVKMSNTTSYPFNKDIDKSFMSLLGSNQDFIKTISNHLHNNIKSKTKDAINLIKMVSDNLLERDMFNMYYENLLETRLLHDCYDYDFELELIKTFSNKDNKIVQNMLNKLEDIKKSKEDENALYTKLKFTVTEDAIKKYGQNIDLNKIDMKKLLPRVFRNYAWTYSKLDNDNMTIPFDLCPYIDVHKQYYNIRYPYRDINYNFNYGTAVIQVKLGNKEYMLQLTTPQMFLLMQFNNQEKISALDLASNLSLPMSKLGKILTSLLKAKILCREPGKLSNDPTMLIYLNQEFNSDSDKISLINLMTQNSMSNANNTEIQDRFTIGRDNLLQAAIVRQMKLSKKITSEGLYDNVKKALPFDPTNFQKILEQCITEGYVLVNGLVLNYIEDSD